MLSPLLWTTPNLGCTLTHGCGSKMGVSFRRPLGSHTDCGRDARVPRGDPQIWDAPSHRGVHPKMGVEMVIWGFRASGG